MDKQSLKQQLPFPYNQDLSTVLRRLNRRTAFGRAKLANDPVTVAYIAAAMRLVQRNLGPGAERKLTDTEDNGSVARPLLSFLSQRVIAAEVANNPDPFPRCGSVSTLRSTWESNSAFIDDLLSFGLWAAQYPGTRQNHVRDTNAEQLITGDAVEALHNLAYWETSTLTNSSTLRLRLIATASSEGDQAVSDIIAKNNKDAQEPWKQLYADFIQVRGLQLRPGITLDEFANILSTCSAGMALHVLGNPTSDVLDHKSQRSLLGKAALAVFYACLERADDPSGLTLDEVVHQLLGEPIDADQASSI